jgi:hypothetical protein
LDRLGFFPTLRRCSCVIARGHQSIEHVADIEDYEVAPAPRGRRSERFQYVLLTLYFAVGRPELQGVVKDHRDQQRDPSNQYVAENGHGE